VKWDPGLWTVVPSVADGHATPYRQATHIYITLSIYFGKKTLGRPRRRWEDNIKMDLRELGWKAWTGLIWLRMGQDARFCERGNEPSVSIKFGEFLD
jgi:hypothetical protein